jgi:anti-sigma factor ChrR (cupin superfamily)
MATDVAQQTSVDLPEAENPLNLPQTSLPSGHLDTESMPWVEQAPGIEMKILRISEDYGTWVVMNRLQPGTTLPTHRHSGGVTAYTISGSWNYLEHDFVAKKGSLIREPAGTAHTLNVDASGTEPAIIFFIIEGGLTHIGPDGNIWGISDAQTEKSRYLQMVKEQGKTLPKNGILS